jgi:flavin-dependent dehydrogenase
MPACYQTFENLGVLEDMKNSSFPVKGSVQFFAGDGKGATPFYFEDHDPAESSWTWQVLRSRFDQMLLDRAADRGAEIRRGCSLKRYLEEDGRVTGVRFEDETGTVRELESRLVVDATGQRAMLARQLGLLQPDPCLQNAAYYTHFEGAHRDTGRDAGATLILHTEDHKTWFWFIPLPDDRVSVGVVGPVDYLAQRGHGDPQAVFDRELERCAALIPRLEGARQARPMLVIKDYSYRVETMAGVGWVLVGDAGGFIDPIYSTGVFLALKSGEMAADCICTALSDADIDVGKLGAFEPELRKGAEAMRKLVYAFYDPGFSFAKFLARYPDCKGQLVELLMGHVFTRPVEDLLQGLDEIFSQPSSSTPAGTVS